MFDDISPDEEEETVEPIVELARFVREKQDIRESVGSTSSKIVDELVEKGLTRDTARARRVYEKLGKELEKQNLDRDRRRDLREARRVLEEAHGLNRIRTRFPKATSLSVRVELPGLKRKTSFATQEQAIAAGFVDADSTYPIAVVSFGRKDTVKGKGRRVKILDSPVVAFGPNADIEANKRYAEILIKEGEQLEKTKKKLQRQQSTTKEVDRRIEENKAEKQRLVDRHLSLLQELQRKFGLVPASTSSRQSPPQQEDKPQEELLFRQGEKVFVSRGSERVAAVMARPARQSDYYVYVKYPASNTPDAERPVLKERVSVIADES